MRKVIDALTLGYSESASHGAVCYAALRSLAPASCTYWANIASVAPASKSAAHGRSRHDKQKGKTEDHDYYPDAAPAGEDLPQTTRDASQPEDYDQAKQSQNEDCLLWRSVEFRSRRAGSRQHAWRDVESDRSHHRNQQKAKDYH